MIKRSTVRHLAWSLWLASAVVAGCSPGAGQRAGSVTLPSVSAPVAAAASGIDPTTLDGKLMFGYQGWFGCPGDGSPLDTWEHWFRRGGAPTASTLRVDLWPDVSELSESER